MSKSIIKKRVLSVILILVIALFVGLSTTQEAMAAEDDKVYYSDLFYGYDTSYMKNDLLSDYSSETYNTINSVYDAYMDDSAIWSALRTALKDAASLPDYISLISDNTGNSNNSYYNALDKANQIFVSKVLSDSIKTTVASDTKYNMKITKGLNKILGVYNKFNENYALDNLTKKEVFTCYNEKLGESDVYGYIVEIDVDYVFTDILPDLSEVSEVMDLGYNALELANAYAIALLMEDIRMETIDNIIQNATVGTPLYDGMTRLKNQLRDGFKTYFIDSYVKEKASDKVKTTVVDALCTAGMDVLASSNAYGFCKAVIGIIDLAVFDMICDIPDMEDLLTTRTLMDYCISMQSVLLTQLNSFNREQVPLEDIAAFEDTFNAYIAIVDSTLDQAEGLEISSNKGTIAALKTKYKDFGYDAYIEYTKNDILGIPQAERAIRPKTSWTQDGQVTLCKASDELEEGNLYMFNGAFRYDLTIYNGELFISENSRIAGNLAINENGTVTFDSGQLEVDGDFSMELPSLQYHNYMTMNNENDYLLVHGDFKAYSYTPAGGSKYLSLITMTGGTAEFKGDFSCPGAADFKATEDSKVIFSGESNQNITFGSCVVIDNLYLKNPNVNIAESQYFIFTLQEDTTISGTENLKLGTIDLNGYDLLMEGSLEVRNFNVAGSAKITEDLFVPEYGTVTFDSGQLEVDGDFSMELPSLQYHNYMTMNNENDYLLVHGDFKAYSYTPAGGSKYLSLITMTGGTAEFKGDFSCPGAADFKATEDSKVIFSGESNQNITFGSCVVIDNLYLKNPNVNIAESQYFIFTLQEDTTISGTENLKLGTIDLNGYDLLMEGSLEVRNFNVAGSAKITEDLFVPEYGTVTFDSGQLEVDGDFSMELPSLQYHNYMTMNNENDYLLVHGDFKAYSYTPAGGSKYLSLITMTGGTAEFKGDFSCPGAADFKATEDSKVIFSGESNQNITFGSCVVIDNLYLKNPNVNIAESQYFIFTLQEDTTISGTENLKLGTIDLNGYDLFVLGELRYSTLIENGGTLTVHCNPLNFEHHEAAEPNCTEDGNIEYWSCTKCGKAFSDAEGDNEISSDIFAIPALGHTIEEYPAVDPTCTEDGFSGGKKCSVCGEIIEGELIPALGHDYHEGITKATLTKNGSTYDKCSICGKKINVTTIYYPKTIKLSATAYTYDGKVKKPAVTIKDSKETTIDPANYAVTYASGRKNVGTYKVTVKMKGDYTGSKTLTFKINPKGTTLTTPAPISKGVTVKWKAQKTKMSTSYVTGYTIELAKDKNFTKGKVSKTIKGPSVVSKKVTGLTGATTYYVRIRTYKVVNGVTYYSPWSAVKTFKTKK